MAELVIEARPRTVKGRSKVKKLRREGWIPAVIYGQEMEPTLAQVPERDLERVLHSGGRTQLVQVAIQGDGTHNVLIREVQRDPIRHTPLHVDFYAVSMREKQEIEIPVVGVGEPEALGADVMVLQVLDTVLVEALPADIPAQIEVDLTLLKPGEKDVITVADLPQLPGVEYREEADAAVFSLSMTAAAEAAAAEEAAAEEVAEGEPEVVAKGKEEEEEE